MGWTTGLTGLTCTSTLPCVFRGPSPGLVGGDVLTMGFTWAEGVEVQRLLSSSTCGGAMGNSRRLLFLGAVGCICCIGRLLTF